MRSREEIARDILAFREIVARIQGEATSLLAMIESASVILRRLDDPDQVITDQPIPLSDGMAKLPTPPPYDTISVSIGGTPLTDKDYAIFGDMLYLDPGVYSKYGIREVPTVVNVSYSHPGALERDVLPLMSQLGIDIQDIRRDMEWMRGIERWTREQILPRRGGGLVGQGGAG